MINYIGYKIKQSTFKTWVAFSRSMGFKETTKGAAQTFFKRHIKKLNDALKPLGLEVWVREIGSE